MREGSGLNVATGDGQGGSRTGHTTDEAVAQPSGSRPETGDDGPRSRHAFTAEPGAGFAGHTVCQAALPGFRSDPHW